MRGPPEGASVLGRGGGEGKRSSWPWGPGDWPQVPPACLPRAPPGAAPPTVLARERPPRERPPRRQPQLLAPPQSQPPASARSARMPTRTIRRRPCGAHEREVMMRAECAPPGIGPMSAPRTPLRELPLASALPGARCPAAGSALGRRSSSGGLASSGALLHRHRRPPPRPLACGRKQACAYSAKLKTRA
jgi:hypothetical protein